MIYHVVDPIQRTYCNIKWTRIFDIFQNTMLNRTVTTDFLGSISGWKFSPLTGLRERHRYRNFGNGGRNWRYLCTIRNIRINGKICEDEQLTPSIRVLRWGVFRNSSLSEEFSASAVVGSREHTSSRVLLCWKRLMVVTEHLFKTNYMYGTRHKLETRQQTLP